MHRRAIAMAAASATAVGMLAAMTPATAAPNEGAKKPYVVILEGDPALAYDGGVKGIAPTAPEEGEKINPRAGNVRAYKAHLKSEQAKVLKQVGVKAKPTNQLTIANNGFAVQLTDAEAAKLRNVRGVAMVMEDVLKQKQTDVSPQFLGLSAEGGAWMSGATGKGVVVGVIDTGIWPEHPSFADPGNLPEPTGPTAAVPCEFGNTDHNPLDKPFDCQNKLIGARDMRTVYKANFGPEKYDSARDYDGHGTHTAATAAGNKDVEAEIFGIDRGTVSGVAYEAGVIAYQGLGDLGGYGSDLAAAIDQAVEDGVDVINYSIGSSSPVIGPDDISFLFAADAGVMVATSAGNSGPGASTVGSPAAVPWLTTVGASTHDRTFEATASLGNGDSVTGASLTEALGKQTLVDAADRKNPLCLTDQPFVPKLKGEIVLCERGVIARVDKSKAVMDGGGSGMILWNNTDAQALVTDNHWIPSVHVTYSDGMKVRAYIESMRPGSNGARPPGKPRAATSATASLTQGAAVETQGSVMADFSSRGPVASPGVAEIIRPDVTAPGVNILAGNTPTPGSGRPGQLFQSISGTSMSSPHVAGLFALIKEVNPEWSAAAAKSALMTTARQDVVKENGSTPADPFDFGAGHVDPGSPSEKNSMFDPGVVYEADLFDYAAYTCAADLGVFSSATCSLLDGLGYSSSPADLNVPSIGVANVAASRTVSRTVTNVSDETLALTAVFEQPAGFTVTADPATVTLAPGVSQEVAFTLTNDASTPDAWVFGSVTWAGNGYAARSPIAAMGTQLSAPAEVSEAGESGSGSFEIAFGYTGAYSVDAYGLAPQVTTMGSVGQDPDQTFDPSDVGNGATLHEVTLTGTEFWRFEMSQSDVPNDDVDLDIFVFGPDGTLVGSSGAGGTNELVELTNPADGAYQVYVHGWGTGGPTVDYTFRTWDVAEPADGGSLQVTGAPPEAVQGETGTISYEWSGAEVGTTELGLLLHNDADGGIARTLIAVSTPAP